MNDERFNELIESIQEAGAYLRAERVDTRVTFVGELIHAPSASG